MLQDNCGYKGKMSLGEPEGKVYSLNKYKLGMSEYFEGC